MTRKLLIFLAAMSAATSALAQTPSEAEQRYQRGVALYQARNFEGALVEFQRAYELSSSTELLFNIGRTQEALSHYPEAASALEDYLRGAQNLPPARRGEVQAVLDRVRGFIAHLRLRVTPTDAVVLLDGQTLAAARLAEEVPVSPGRHVVAARRAGYRDGETSVVVASGDASPVELSLVAEASTQPVAPSTVDVAGAPDHAVVEVDGRPATTPHATTPGEHALRVTADGYLPWAGAVRLAPGATQRVRVHLARSGLEPTPFVAATLATGLFVVAGATLGMMTLSTHDTFLEEGVVTQRARDLADQGETLRLLTNVSFGLAAAGGIAAVVLATQTRFRGPRASTAEFALAPTPHGASAGVAVHF